MTAFFSDCCSESVVASEYASSIAIWLEPISLLCRLQLIQTTVGCVATSESSAAALRVRGSARRFCTARIASRRRILSGVEIAATIIGRPCVVTPIVSSLTLGDRCASVAK